MYILLTVEPRTNQAGLWTFGIIILAAFISLVWFLVMGGKKEEETKPHDKPKGKVIRLDEHEAAIGEVSDNQRN
jgi:hypothetical protein